MTVIKFPGKGEEKSDQHDDRKVYYVCKCGCTTFVLRPGYIIECANCKREHGGDMGAWQLDCEPEVPPIYEGEPVRNITVIDFHESDLSIERVRRRISAETTGFVIHATKEGDVHTWGTISGVAQHEWLARQLATAIRLLSDDDAKVAIIDEEEAEARAAADKVAARILHGGDEPDMIDWLENLTE